MLNRLLDFRFKQFGRMLREIGAVYLLLLIVVCGGLLLSWVDQLVSSQSAFISLLVIMIIGSIHSSRKDLNFLKMLNINHRKLFMWEYLLISLPFLIAFLAGRNFGAVGISLLGVVLIAFLPNPEWSAKSMTSQLEFSFLPKNAFEVRSYLRRAGLPLGLVYLLGLLGTKFMTIAILMVVLIALVFISFFDEVEDKILLESLHFRRGILFEKSRIYLGVLYLILLPYVVLFLVFHLKYWYIMLAAIAVSTMLTLFNIFYKYAHYNPYRRRIYNSMANGMFLFCTIIPFLFPVTLFYLMYYWRKAKRNMLLYYAGN